jgi:hypothetical protein
MVFVEDYIDEDVAYLLGLIAARGTLNESGGQRQIAVDFSYVNLKVSGTSSTFDQDTAIKIGLLNIQRRLQELLDTRIDIVENPPHSVGLVARFNSRNMMWRNIMTLTGGSTQHHTFKIPSIFFNPELPLDYKREFIKGYGDVAGNIRSSNNFMNQVNRVRLDVMNANWDLPVQLCLLLQNVIGVNVQMVQWGHPNTRGDGQPFKEHQIQIFAKEYGKIGFYFQHKQKILEEFIIQDDSRSPNHNYRGCPGRKRVSRIKDVSLLENDPRVPATIRGKHYNAYWQICKDFGCDREPPSDGQLALDLEATDDEIEDGNA